MELPGKNKNESTPSLKSDSKLRLYVIVASCCSSNNWRCKKNAVHALRVCKRADCRCCGLTGVALG